MVVEHTFVTTLPPDETINRSREFLASRGFLWVAKGFPISGEQQASLEMTRGKKSMRGVKSITQLPQQLIMQWDRGRVTVAASIMNQTADSSLALTRMYASKKAIVMETELMTGIASGMELLLAHQRPDAEAGEAWGIAEYKIEAAKKRASRRNWIILGIVLFLMFGSIALIFMFNRSGG